MTAKVAKARAVDGYSDRDFVSEFDRSDYRDRKRTLRQTRPDLSRRERKAEALTQRDYTPQFKGIEAPDNWNYQRPGVKRGVVTVGEITVDNTPVKITTRTPQHTVTADTYKYEYNPMSYDQFGSMAEEHMRNSGVYRNGADTRAMNQYIQNQYRLYRKNGMDYKWVDPSGSLVYNPQERLESFNTDPNNWGGRQRNEIDFSGQKTTGQLLDDVYGGGRDAWAQAYHDGVLNKRYGDRIVATGIVSPEMNELVEENQDNNVGISRSGAFGNVGDKASTMSGTSDLSTAFGDTEWYDASENIAKGIMAAQALAIFAPISSGIQEIANSTPSLLRTMAKLRNYRRSGFGQNIYPRQVSLRARNIHQTRLPNGRYSFNQGSGPYKAYRDASGRFIPEYSIPSYFGLKKGGKLP